MLFFPLTVFPLFSRSGYERLNALQISLMDGVQQFSLPPVGLLFTAMKKLTLSVTLFLDCLISLAEYLQKVLKKSEKECIHWVCVKHVQERAGRVVAVRKDA